MRHASRPWRRIRVQRDEEGSRDHEYDRNAESKVHRLKFNCETETNLGEKEARNQHISNWGREAEHHSRPRLHENTFPRRSLPDNI